MEAGPSARGWRSRWGGTPASARLLLTWVLLPVAAGGIPAGFDPLTLFRSKGSGAVLWALALALAARAGRRLVDGDPGPQAAGVRLRRWRRPASAPRRARAAAPGCAAAGTCGSL